MPVCSSGTSGPRPGVSASIVVDAAYVQSLLPSALAWLYPYLPYMHGLQIGDVGAFCSVDPPAFTVPTGPEIYSFLTGGPIVEVQAVSDFMQNITRAYLWYNLCQCNAVATPPAPSAPSPPSDLPGVNPPNTVGIPIPPCATFDRTVRIDEPGQHPTKAINVDTYFGYSGGPALSTLITPLPAGVTTIDARVVFNPPTATQTDPFAFNSARLRWFTGTTNSFNDTFVFESGTDGATPSSFTLTQIGKASGADGYILEATIASGQNALVSAHIDWTCQSGNSIGSPQPCCTATDPLTVATLNLIVQRLDLIQRQIVPFAYVSGPTHSALSGTGTISVQGILGLLLNVSVPSRAGAVDGTPETRWDVGWINFGTTDGYAERQFIQSDSQVMFPPNAGAWTIVGYTLLPGVTATITELIREP